MNPLMGPCKRPMVGKALREGLQITKPHNVERLSKALVSDADLCRPTFIDTWIDNPLSHLAWHLWCGIFKVPQVDPSTTP